MTETIQPGARAGALEEVRRLYERGLYLQAWRAAAPLGPLEAWSGLEGRILAGQLLNQLGAPARSSRCHLRLHRLHPESHRAWYWVALSVRARLGPFVAQRLLRDRVDRVEGPGEGGAELVALAASTAAMLKDFLEAERLMARAEAMDPASAWIALERAHVLRAADDYAGALAAAEEAIRLRPSYRPAVEARADLLVLLGRDDEAAALLVEGMERFESVGIAWSLAQLQEERGDVAGAEETLDRLEAWSPLKSRGLVRYLARRRSDLAWLRGDREACLRLARASGSPFHEKLAERLEAGRAGPRRVLPVPFVRQNDKTCAPATLTSLARYYGMEAAHLQVAEQICYDGTPNWAQRRWAEQQGFVVREFTVTWEAARALVDRGLAFAMSTVDPGSGHLQAVAGYDEGRGTLLLRDPGSRSLVELAEAGLEAQRANGPQGQVMVPRARAAELEGLPLPDAHLHDLYHQAQAALVDHRRADAERARRALAEAAPGHRLALQADRALAGYDADEEARLAATEALLALFPDDVNLRLSKQGSLAALGRHLARVEYLRAECAPLRQARGERPHPLLSLALGEAIRLDARALPEVEALARHAVGRLPYDPAAYRLLANAAWERGDRREALRAYRAAACLGWAEEHHAESLFRAARSLGQVEEGLELLRWRAERLGGLSGGPATTLYQALDEVERTGEALAALAAAVERRPRDGELLLFAARARAAAGELEAARALLERARPAAHPAQVVRAEAVLADRAGDVATAAARWTALADLEPLDVGAARAEARCLAATRGEAEALAQLRRRVERFPHHLGLSHLLLERLQGGPPAVYQAELRRLLAAHPSDAWAWRELAVVLSEGHDLAGALDALDRAEAIDPSAAALHNVRSSVLELAGRIEEARAELRRSLESDADGEWALRRLLQLSAGPEERRACLRLALAELRRQVIQGDGILAYQSLAQGVLAPDEVLADLREARQLRPDLWHTWVALARQLRHAGALAEAGQLLAEAAGRFPLLPRLPVEQAEVARAAGDRAAHRRALERAVALSPGWPEAVMALCGVLQDAADFAAQLVVLDRALRHTPDAAALHGWRADALRMMGRHDEARAALERALRLDPGYGWAWDTLVELCRREGAPERPLALAEGLAGERPHDAGAWVLVARAQREPADRLAPLARALEVGPRHLAACELRVDTLVELGRFDEALAAADPAAFGGVPPRSLRLRAVRIQDDRGHRAAALAALRALVQEHPDYLEAWRILADWEEAAGDAAAALAAAEAMVRLAPHRAISHGYRGHALLLSGAREEGKAALRRALDLDPSYGWAVEKLLAAELEDGWTQAQALEELRDRLRRCPDHEGLGRALLVRMRDEPAAEVEAELRRFLGVHPENAWGWRELGSVLSRAGRTDEALAALRRAEELEPGVSSLHNVRAAVLKDAGRLEEAKGELLRALACDADDDWPLARLLELSTGPEERGAHLRAAVAELRRQAILGDGLLGVQRRARGILPPEELLAELRQAHRERPDLWQSWVALARQLAQADAAGEAAEVLAGAEARFPGLARVPVEQAALARLRGDAPARRAALERAILLAPEWTEPVCDLAEVLQDAGEHQAELDVLDRALRHAPGEAILHGWRADALRLLGREAEALDELEQALRLDPGYRWGWNTLTSLCKRGDAERPRRVADALARERPHDPRAWVLVARSRPAPAERLEPLERALALEPRDLAAAELRIDALLELERRGEAVAAAAELVRLTPTRAVSHGYHGHALLAAGERAQGIAALRRAVELDETYTWALERLVEAEIEHGEAEAAGRDLSTVERRIGPGAAWLGRLRLAVRARATAEARQALRWLARSEGEWTAAELARTFDEAGLGAVLDAELAELLPRGDSLPRIGGLWASRAAAAARWEDGGRLDGLLQASRPTAAALAAAEEWVNQLAEAGRGGDVRRLVDRHGAKLAASTGVWGAVGYALLHDQRPLECARWLAAWRGREGLEPWMLLNLAQALRDLDRRGEAAEVSRAALALPADHTAVSHRILLEADAALAGAESPLRGEPLPEKGHYRRIAALAAAVRAARAAPAGEAFRAARPHLQAAHRRVRSSSANRFLCSYRREVAWAVARRGGALAPLWYLRALRLLGAV